jgi:hypothetical protein
MQTPCNTINETAAFHLSSPQIALNLHDGNVKDVMGNLMKNMELDKVSGLEEYIPFLWRCGLKHWQLLKIVFYSLCSNLNYCL